MKKKPATVLVVAAALIAEDGRVLMQRRKRGAEHGGLWEFPGGKVEENETPAQSLCREIAEELALELKVEALLPLTFAATPELPYVILLYTCRDWEGEPVCLDGEEIAWIEPGAIFSLDMPPLDVPLARVLQEHLKRSK